ncbi:MAG TPA: hypothetical protein VHV83_19110, partial [Armatimonadota bacterium]|nr:hypothetical protein [Armatimonadota bacterium]
MMHKLPLSLWYCLGIMAVMLIVAGCSDGWPSSRNQHGGNTVTVTFTDQGGNASNPAYLAFQDGTNAWQKVDINSSGRYT